MTHAVAAAAKKRRAHRAGTVLVFMDVLLLVGMAFRGGLGAGGLQWSQPEARFSASLRGDHVGPCTWEEYTGPGLSRHPTQEGDGISFFRRVGEGAGCLPAVEWGAARAEAGNRGGQAAASLTPRCDEACRRSTRGWGK